MSNTSLTANERHCLKMWFRQAIVEVERREALGRISAFYGEQKPRESHHLPIMHRAVHRNHSTHAKELV